MLPIGLKHDIKCNICSVIANDIYATNLSINLLQIADITYAMLTTKAIS